MISPEFVQRMASYNRWQNRSLYTAAAGLSDAERRRERGAFFGSIHATLNHILWADQVWMSRLADMPPPAVRRIPASTTIHEQWSALEGARRDYDEVTTTGRRPWRRSPTVRQRGSGEED
jgi:uncharacterized damage-inducible protein DinB